eukprot:CAMPEP_0201539450 /NCGR_PEP_ID=MMETSP0161_2-20130828/70414_1 /ASSEMBLY_ACC=CAM_ASM_000251 /TAXON_ID=180227 /ORGANISM="Neoparamoeba aestuarina, Strain SoJaBio B1-5/56/2" /LENGTH=471 /DNA_ID=CAMNT_0047946847 /DNA_START=82 /DNA_END=1497 /DNA_ORIENTATION=-
MEWFKSFFETTTKQEEKQTPSKNFVSFANKLKSVEQFAHDKISWHAVPEHLYDHLPIVNDEETKKFADSLPRIDVNTLYSLKDEAELKKLGENMVEQIQKHGVVVLKLDGTYKKTYDDFNQAIKKFFDKKVDEKMEHRSPGDERKTYSGYSTIIFDNRDAIRDPEVRDIFQMRLAEVGQIPWPTEEIERTAVALYTRQFTTTIHILSCLSLALDFPLNHLSSMLASSSPPTPPASQNTNMCAFHYWDHFGYKTEQRCMIHQDRGLVTLLPPPSAPGLHLLDRRASSPDNSQWLPLDKYTADDDMLFYCGLAMEYVSSGRVPSSFHRVVRQPGAIRYSCPFEAKPYDTCVLLSPPSSSPSVFPNSPSFPDPLPEKMTAKDLYVNADWERIRFKVTRQEIFENQALSFPPASSSVSSSCPSPSAASDNKENNNFSCGNELRASVELCASFEELDRSCFPAGREEMAMMVDVDA